MSSIEKSNVSNLEGKKYSPHTTSDTPPPLEKYSPHTPSYSPPLKSKSPVETFVVKQQDGRQYNIPVEYKYIYEHLVPEYRQQLLVYNENYRNEVLRKIKKEYEEKGKSDYVLSESEMVRIAIIIPFRDSEKSKPRTKQLNQLVEWMKAYLSGYDYKIFVIEQSDDGRKFNRGQLLNIGFKLAEAEGYTNFIFHDVDLIPIEGLKKYYITNPEDKPVHIAAVWDRYNSNPSYFGGIVAFNSEMFETINGYPNNFWGWGGEDDELLKRTKKFYDILKPKNGKISDLENLNLEQKLDFLRENDLKFMQKKEALAEHDATWRKNGLSNLVFVEVEEKPCGPNCEIHVVNLESDIDKPLIKDQGEALEISKEIPQQLFREEIKGDAEEFKKISPPEAFNKLVKLFYDSNLYRNVPKPNLDHSLD